VFFVSFALALVVRYRRLSSYTERQQIKWVVSASALGMGVFAVFTLSVNLAGAIGSGVSIFPAVQPLIDFQLMGLLALSVGIAILRYRLWDIDLIINRALVYGVLTLALTLVYFGSVVVFQSGLRLVSGESTTLASVGSTLLLAALFRPLRSRVQAAIDRRFYRRKYNAGQVLTAFGAVLRNDTYADLDQASDALLGVVADTLQPSHVSLWLTPGPPSNRGSR
jgi:asparagine N-glycosylation enzyme membrane subunit Stt3